VLAASAGFPYDASPTNFGPREQPQEMRRDQNVAKSFRRRYLNVRSISGGLSTSTSRYRFLPHSATHMGTCAPLSAALQPQNRQLPHLVCAPRLPWRSTESQRRAPPFQDSKIPRSAIGFVLGGGRRSQGQSPVAGDISGTKNANASTPEAAGGKRIGRSEPKRTSHRLLFALVVLLPVGGFLYGRRSTGVGGKQCGSASGHIAPCRLSLIALSSSRLLALACFVIAASSC
jgi:hypothetical protein